MKTVSFNKKLYSGLNLGLVLSMGLMAEEKIIDPKERFLFGDQNSIEFNQAFGNDPTLGDVGLLNLPFERFKSADGKLDMFIAVDRAGQSYVITKDASGKTLSGTIIPNGKMAHDGAVALNKLKIQKEVAEMEAYIGEKERAEGKKDKMARYFIQGVKQLDPVGNNFYDMNIVIQANQDIRTRDSFTAKRGEKVSKRLQDKYKKIEKQYERRLEVGADGALYMTDAKGKNKVLISRDYAQLSKSHIMNFSDVRTAQAGLERTEHPSLVDTTEDDAHHHKPGVTLNQFEEDLTLSVDSK